MITTTKRVDRFLFAAVVVGFCTFDAITTGMWFSRSYQRTLESPPAILATVALIAIIIVSLWLWAFRTDHPDRRSFAIAVFVTAAVAITYQALGPSIGWWSGLAFAPPLPLQALVYGWQLTSVAALLLLGYRMLAAYRPRAALISYGILLLLLIPATVWSERISLQQGDYAFEKGYSPLWDALWFVALAALPLITYETLRRRRASPRQGSLR
jgi:putative Mn2+ efflux pump MntP